MSARALLLVRSLLLWLVWFAATRLLFLAYQWPLWRDVRGGTGAGAFVHGARMDVAAAAYLTTVPWLVLLVTALARGRVVAPLLRVYFMAAAPCVSLLTVVDLAVYAGWRTRLDATVLPFMRTPREMVASSASSPWVRLLVLCALLTLLTIWLARRWIVVPAARFDRAGVASTLFLALSGTGLFLLARGGVQWTPINQSTVFFSDDDFANQVALNPAWTFADAVVAARKVPSRNPYRRLTPNDAGAVIDSLLAQKGATRPLLRLARPNVLFIVWESATAKVFERLGGVPGVTPAFDSLTHEGILFDSIFASAERSAQGLVALHSSYPALPHQQILNLSHKIDTLPKLGRTMADAGYQTSFYYGGELEFANLKAYVIASRYQRVVGLDQFARSDRNSKWGAHDHVVYARQLHDLERGPRPFFSTLVTLSSHEPFEIPVAPRFPGGDEETLFLNAHHYADRSLGDFIRRAQRQPWWDSTLVIVTADHGHVLPGPHDGTRERIPDRFHVPMLWLGGALAVRDTVVHRIGSQVDVMPTLLAQLGMPCRSCRWGKDLLRDGEGGFAYFAYRDGFSFIDPNGWTLYDVASGRTLDQEGNGEALRTRRGVALLQATFDDFLAR